MRARCERRRVVCDIAIPPRMARRAWWLTLSVVARAVARPVSGWIVAGAVTMMASAWADKVSGAR